MKKEIFEIIKKEFQYIGILFFLSLVAFKIAFYKESIVVIFRAVLSLFWLFAIPGYFIMFYWADKLDFIERFVIGIAASAGAVGILSYYIGLIGLNIKYHVYLVPVGLIIIGALMMYKGNKC